MWAFFLILFFMSREGNISPCAIMLGLLYIQRLSARNPAFTHSLSSKELFLASMVRATVLAVVMGSHCFTACTSVVVLDVCLLWVDVHFSFSRWGGDIEYMCSAYAVVVLSVSMVTSWMGCLCGVPTTPTTLSRPQVHSGVRAPAVVLTPCSCLPTPDCSQQVLEWRRRTWSTGQLGLGGNWSVFTDWKWLLCYNTTVMLFHNSVRKWCNVIAGCHVICVLLCNLLPHCLQWPVCVW